MRLAVIDIGTNSTRLLVADLINNEINQVYSSLRASRIGENLGTNAVIKDEVLQRTLDCLVEYRDKCLDLNVKIIRVIATSAVRDASNRADVLAKIEESTALKVELISGEKEAYLSYLGATSDVKKSQDKNSLVLDIGGGSTELVFLDNDEISAQSVQVGAVRLAQTKETDKVKELLQPLVTKLPNSFQLIGVGGTITSLASIKLKLEEYDPLLIQGFVLSFTDVQKLSRDLHKMTLEERKKLKGLDPKRADIIPFGSYILEEMMKLLEIKEIRVSEKDLMHGLIIDEFTEKNN